MNEPIHTCIANWHQLLHGEFPGGLDELLHDDVVFLSPVVFTPQVGKEITKLYLSAAGTTLSGGNSLESAEVGDESGDSDTGSGGFRYTKEILSGHQAMLEFETTMDGKYVNGVDIITCDDEARIVEFRVMIRPLQAINLLHQQMKDMLEQLSS
ncbi:MAG: nuclear transport factor 2 family protein [Acidimicrobiia bacterium]|nr:nuclear transport factor 2 family protein [Acidimicrobiia bacterium]